MSYQTADEQRAAAAAFALLYEADLPRSEVMSVGFGTRFADTGLVETPGIVVWTREGKQEKVKQALPATFNQLPVYVEGLAPPVQH